MADVSATAVFILEMCDFILPQYRLGNLCLTKFEIPRIIGFIKGEKSDLHMKFLHSGPSSWTQCCTSVWKNSVSRTLCGDPVGWLWKIRTVEEAQFQGLSEFLFDHGASSSLCITERKNNGLNLFCAWSFPLGYKSTLFIFPKANPKSVYEISAIAWYLRHFYEK